MLAFLLAIPLVAASPASPASAAEDAVVRHKSAAFGTVVEIMAIAPAAPKGGATHAGEDAPFEAAFDEARRMQALVDEDDAKSVVARINEGSGGAAIVVDPDVFGVLSELQRLAKLTKGAFDVTGAAYASAWQFSANGGSGDSGTDKERGVPP